MLDDIPVLLEHIDAVRSHLRMTLERIPAAVVAQRPPTGAWSVLENVRHLLFAEQLHLGRFVPGQPIWRPLGFTLESMRAMRKLPPVDVGTTPSLSDVLAEWDATHATTVADLANAPTDAVQKALARNLKHLRAHAAVVEGLARKASR